MRLAVTVLVLVAVVAACGDDSSTPPDGPTSPSVTVVVEVDDGSDEQTEQVAEVLRRRLDSLGVSGEVAAQGYAVEVTVSEADGELVRQAVEGPGRLEFRPVLAMAATEQDALAAAEHLPELADREPVADAQGTWYLLGPVALTGDAVESAEALPPQSQSWSVLPTLLEGPQGLDAFNDIAGACFAGAARCPAMTADGRGLLAIIYDGRVLSVPAIQAAAFERDQIMISGDLTETEARAVAASIDAGASPLGWTLRG